MKFDHQQLPRRARACVSTVCLAALVALTACGGGGGGESAPAPVTPAPVTPVPVPVNQAPTPARLVEVGSSAVGALTVSWLPATDDSTAASALRYQVHASVDAAFVPSATTLRASTTGSTSATITAGLTPGARYTVKVVALDQQDAASAASAALDAVVSNTVATVVPGVATASLSTSQVASVGANSVVLATGVTAPAVGSVIASSEANGGQGFLRRVASTSTSAAGVTTVTTSPVSVAQVLQQVRVSSTYRLDTVPTEVAQAAAALERRSTQRLANGSERQTFNWPETGLSYGTDAAANVQRRSILAVRQPSALGGVVSDGFKSSGGATVNEKWGQISGQTRVEVNEGKSGQDTWTVDITSNDKPLNSLSKVGICKVELGPVRYNGDGGKPELVKVSLGDYNKVENRDGNRVTRATQAIKFEAGAGAGADKPYRVKVTAYLDEAGDNCTGDDFFGTWREQVHIEVLINVTQDTFPTQEAAEETYSGSAGYSIVNRVVTSFSPKLVFDQEISGARLQSARISVSASPLVEQTLTLRATAQGTMDATKTVVKPRTFRKVYVTPAGIPIVISGEFKIDLRIQGNVSGELNATEVLNIGYEEVSFGVEYRNGQFVPVQSATPVYSLKIAGDGKAHADLTLTLLPRLELRAWEALTGVAVLAPALKAEAGVEGLVRLDAMVDFENDAQLVTAADADYRLTQASLFAGLKAHVYADLSIWDERLLVFPNESAKKDDYNTFKEIELLAWKELMGLPTLSAFMPDGEGAKHPTDTRLLKIRGVAADVSNPLFTLFPTVLPESFMPWTRWTAAKIVQQLAVPPASYDRRADPAGDESVTWVLFTQPGTYTVRLGGHSKLGAWARQYVEIEVPVVDENANGIMDWWETRYGLTGNSGAEIANADPDGDGATNLQEWLAGTDPTKGEAPPGRLMASPSTATVLQSIQLWVTEAVQAVASVVWNFGAGIAEQVASVANGISTTVTQAYATTGVKQVVVTFKNAVGAVLGVRSTDITVVAAGPAVTAIEPLQAVAGTARSFVVTGRALPSGLRFQLSDCRDIVEAPGGSETRREFSCTFAIDTEAGNYDGTVALTDSPFGATPLFEFTVAVGRPSLGAVQPTSTTRTLSTSFEFTGQDLPTSGLTVVPLEDSRSTCQAPNNATRTGFGVACELFKVGAQVLEVRQGTAVLGSVTVNVASNVTGVTWASPSTSNSGTVLFGETVTYKVAGTNLLADTTMGFAVQRCGVSNTEVGVGSNTERTFTCFFNNEAGAVAGQMPGVVKDAPGGQVLLQGWNVPVEVPVVVPVPAGTLLLPATSYVRGENVALSANGYGPDTLMNAPPYTAAANAAEWDFSVAAAGSYELIAEYAAAESRPVTVAFDGVITFTGALSATTGGWFPANRQLVSLGQVQLGVGAHTMRVARPQVFPHIKGFKLVLSQTGPALGLLNPANGNRYEVITCGTWLQCRDAARAKGGELVTIRSQAENDWLVANVLPTAQISLGAWINVIYSPSLFAWTSATGVPITYNNWSPGNPNNSGGQEIYGMIYSHPTVLGYWNDANIDGSGGVSQAIVEYGAPGLSELNFAERPDTGSGWDLTIRVTAVDQQGHHGSFNFGRGACTGTLTFKGVNTSGEFVFQENHLTGNCHKTCDIVLPANASFYNERCTGSIYTSNSNISPANRLWISPYPASTDLRRVLGLN